MNKKLSMIVLALAILIVLLLIQKSSGYDAKCETTKKTYKDGAMCFKSNGTSDSTLKTVDECCKVPGQVWKF